MGWRREDARNVIWFYRFRGFFFFFFFFFTFLHGQRRVTTTTTAGYIVCIIITRYGTRKKNTSKTVNHPQLYFPEWIQISHTILFVGICTKERKEKKTNRPWSHWIRVKYYTRGFLISGRTVFFRDPSPQGFPRGFENRTGENAPVSVGCPPYDDDTETEFRTDLKSPFGNVQRLNRKTATFRNWYWLVGYLYLFLPGWQLKCLIVEREFDCKKNT